MRKLNIIEYPSIDKGRIRLKSFCTYNYSYVPSDDLLLKLKNKKYFIKTHGCQANIRDEETLSGLLNSLNMERVETKEEADIAIINTCAVRENAEDKVLGEIGEFKNLKAKKKNLILCICGCMVGQPHIVNKLTDTYEHVDIIFGTHNIQDFVRLLDIYIKDPSTRLVDVSSKSGDIYEDMPSLRVNKFKAFVNISYGCDKFCTYCIVPYTRGKERSRDIKDILKECSELVKQGYQEITLLGQNVDSYGKDLNSNVDFAYLLEEVAKLGVPRLRFLTSYPSDFKDNVIDVMAKYPNIMKYLHLPVQSGSDSILKKMGRRYTKEQYLDLVKKIKEKIPEIAISTDIIVGFPNETYEEFLETVDLVKQVGYASAFTFIYSPRKGTPAARLKDDVSYETKVKRFKELVEVLEVDVNKYANSLIDKVIPVLVEGPSKKDPNILTGVSEANKIIHFVGDKSLIGKIVNVKITKNHVYSLVGEMVNE